jgi:hypothetical protein
MNLIKKICALSALVLSGAVSVPASAGVCTGGFLADVACITGLVSPSIARSLDRAHRGVGAPLNQLNPFGQRGGRASVPMGNRCLTQWGVSNPGPWNPLGSPCWVGNHPGYVVY